MTAYTDFVKANYDKVRELPNKDRFKKLAEMFKAQKGKADVVKAPKEKKSSAKGAGLIGDIARGVSQVADMFGAGEEMPMAMPEKKTRVRKTKTTTVM